MNCSFLWRTEKGSPDGLRVYKWTGRNDYVAFCDMDGFSFGGGYVRRTFFFVVCNSSFVPLGTVIMDSTLTVISLKEQLILVQLLITNASHTVSKKGV